MRSVILVDHVVIIVKENHTFDNYFGTFPKAEGDASLKRAENPPPKFWLKRHVYSEHQFTERIGGGRVRRQSRRGV